MKRRDIKSAVLIIMALLVMMVTACGEDMEKVWDKIEIEPINVVIANCLKK